MGRLSAGVHPDGNRPESASRADAEEFLRDHHGRRILRYEEVKRELPGKLDAGRFE